MGEDHPSQTFLAETLQVYEDIYASHVSKTAVDSAADGSNLGLYHTHMKMSSEPSNLNWNYGSNTKKHSQWKITILYKKLHCVKIWHLCIIGGVFYHRYN